MSEQVTRLLVAYDGAPFAGWAEQEGVVTVAGELRLALQTVLRRPVELTVAGRTDRGVHALGQVVSYPGPIPSLRGVNALLPNTISVLAAERAPDGFSARRDARSRSYLYRVFTRTTPSPFEQGRALWWQRPLQREALARCAEAIVGQHDFTAFTPTQTEHVFFKRTVTRAAWIEDGDLLWFEIEADAFLRHMNRVLVGTMLEVGVGRRSVAEFCDLLEGRPRSRAGVTAPPHGLYFVGARY